MPTPRRLGTRWWSLDADDGRIGPPPVDVAPYPGAVNPPRPPVPPRPPAGVDWPRVINPD
jgi:hypothetical protein